MPGKQKLLIWTAVVAVFVAVVVYGATRDRVAEDLSAIRALGVPTSRDALNVIHSGTGEDAYPDFKRFRDGVMASTPRLRAEINLGFGSATSFDPAWILSNLKELGSPYSDFIEGTNKPSWVIGSEEKALPMMGTIQFGERALPRIALAKWKTGDLDGAIANLSAADRYAALLEQNPGYNGLVKRTFLRSCSNAILNDSRSNSAKLQKIIAGLDYEAPEPNFRYILARYVCTLSERIKDPKKSSDQSDESVGWLDKFLAPRRIKGKLATDVRRWRKVFERLPKDHVGWMEAQDTLREVLNKMSTDPPDPAKPFERDRSTLQDAIGLCGQWGIERARRRALIMKARIYLYRVEHGKFPTSLPKDELNSIDPFTGRPMEYRVQGQNAILRYAARVDNIF